MAGTARLSLAAQGANKTLETTIMISEEANPTGQRTRVTDMNMSLTF